MDVTLEQSLAAVVRFIQDNAEKGTGICFDEIPEKFYVPSVYFQIPTTSGRKVSLMTYRTRITLNCWFMEAKDWDAYNKAAGMRDSIMMSNCVIPVYDEKGEKTGSMKIGEPETRRIDEGIVQLSLTYDVYSAPEKEHTQMQKFYLVWRNITQRFKNGGGESGS